MDKILIITGPTASGKTALSIRIAKELDCEIISCDSMQIFKKMDIGSAKVKKDEMQGIPHHMIDILEPNQEFSVNEFISRVKIIIRDIIKRDRLPLLVGGTGFFIYSLIYGLSDLPSKDDNIRGKYEKIFREKGEKHLYGILKDKWPERAKELDVSDKKRIIRALEIYDLGGTKKFYLKPERQYEHLMFYIDIDRELLRERIERRAKRMIEDGLETEVREILEGDGFSKQAAKGIGYNEMITYIKDKKSPKINKVVDDIATHTRQFSKRQRTFFKNKFENMIFLDFSDINIGKIKNSINTFLEGK